MDTCFSTFPTTAGTRIPRADKGGLGKLILSSHHTAPRAGTYFYKFSSNSIDEAPGKAGNQYPNAGL